jgi:hypothetical protein
MKPVNEHLDVETLDVEMLTELETLATAAVQYVNPKLLNGKSAIVKRWWTPQILVALAPGEISDVDAAFMAKMSPWRALALLSEVRRLGYRIATMTDVLAAVFADRDAWRSKADSDAARAASLDAEVSSLHSAATLIVKDRDDLRRELDASTLAIDRLKAERDGHRCEFDRSRAEAAAPPRDARDAFRLAIDRLKAATDGDTSDDELCGWATLTVLRQRNALDDVRIEFDRLKAEREDLRRELNARDIAIVQMKAERRAKAEGLPVDPSLDALAEEALAQNSRRRQGRSIRGAPGRLFALAVGRWLGRDPEDWRYELEVQLDGTFTQTVHRGASSGECVKEGRIEVRDGQMIRTFTRNDCNTAYVGKTVYEEVVSLDADAMVLRTEFRLRDLVPPPAATDAAVRPGGGVPEDGT